MGAETLLIAGGIQLYGQMKANKMQAKAERANAAYFREQKEFQEMVTRRELDIFEDESNAFIGQKVSALAESGVSLSGSSLQGLGTDKAKIARETAAIALGGENSGRLAQMRAEAADRNARRLGSFEHNALQAVGIGLNTYANVQMAGGLNKTGGRQEFFSGARRSK